MTVNVLALIGLLFLPDSKACIHGFPGRDTLVSDVFSQTGPAVRLIPDIRFTCNSSVVGYTVAMVKKNGEQHPMIQIWREIKTNSCVYQKVGTSVPVDESLCTNGLNETSTNVFHCDLNKASHVPVQFGDILGLELPPANDAASNLFFARVVRGPINYVFSQQQLPSSLARLQLPDSTSQLRQELPQITLRVESGQECTSGLTDRHILASEITDDDGHSSTTVTILIPDMNFTCNGTLAGLSFTAIDRRQGNQDPKVQLWRRNISQSGIYYRVGPAISLNFSETVCADGLVKIASRTYWCIFKEEFHVAVLSGDILGLELPPAVDNDVDLLFTRGSGGPTNYLFHHKLNSTVANLSMSDSIVKQLPQITFSLTSDQCSSGFPKRVSRTNEGGLGDSTKVTTRLFPELRFGCQGTIVRLKAAVVNRNGQQSPKVQIWRESENQPGIYYKLDPDVPVVYDRSVCVSKALSGGIFRCTLNETFQVSVEVGDILGLELPPQNDDDFDIYFVSGGPANYIFEGHLNSTVNISEAAHLSNNLPQISFVAMLENESEAGRLFAPPSCGNRHTTASSPTLTTTSETTDGTTSGVVHSSIGVAIIIGSTAACIIAVVSVIILLVAIIYKRQMDRRLRDKRFTYLSDIQQSHATKTIDKPDTACVHYVCSPTEVHDYAMIPESNKFLEKEQITVTNDAYVPTVKLRQMEPDSNIHSVPVLLTTDVEDHGYVVPNILENCQGETESSAEKSYWEPAESVNELYKQLNSKKYREIVRHQVKIGEKLGSGQFGIVSRGVWESPKGAMDVAVKELQPRASEEEKVKFLQEAAINGQFRHPNVVMLMGVVTVGKPVMIVLELLSNGDLKTFLTISRLHLEQLECMGRPPSLSITFWQDSLTSTAVDEQLLLKFCQHIASGMSYLASKSFVHRDLAARNILVSEDKICKISDFGMSRNLVDEKYISHGGMVPLKWMSPEAIEYSEYSTASDVWSFGCVMYEIWSLGHIPFEDLSNAEVLTTVGSGHRLPPPSRDIQRNLQDHDSMLPESAHRPTFPQLVELVSRADFELFAWDEEDLRKTGSQAKIIGAPLETSMNLYSELQRSYVARN